ncbi:ATP synthase subunit b [Acetobacteraceae bacterium EV16G]|uniref:ATP synthase subunit b n=1 Tax=Sorlinia euscelidii TaxID=3081148 RepID=A0ABU7TZQ1_9PROT
MPRATRSSSTRFGILSRALILTSGVYPAFARAEGMPQLDFKNTLLLGQVFWGAIIFIAFYLVLSRSALPRVERVLTDRRQRIEGDLETARHARRGADHAVEELRRVRKEAAAQAQENIDRVLREAREAAESENRAMAERLNREIVEAEKRIAAEREAAMAALPDVATSTAEAIITKILTPTQAATTPSGQAIREAVARALPRQSD